MKISIITVVCNAENTLERAVKSVISQQNVDLEYIVIDGGSSDHTLDIIRRYEEKISFWVSEPDNGIYDAMNKGVRFSSGDIVAFLNSDDWYEPNAIQDVVNTFENKNIDVLCADARIVDGNFSRVRKADMDGRTLIRQLPTSHQAVFSTRKWFEKVGGFNLKYLISADYEWMTRSVRKGCRMETLHKVVVNFSMGGISTRCGTTVYKEIRETAFKYYLNTPLEADVRRYYAYHDFVLDYGENEDGKDDDFWKTVHVTLPEKKKIYIFGGGRVGVECYKVLRKAGCSITGFVDNCSQNNRKLLDKDVLSPEEINKITDFVIIASTRYEGEMKRQLEEEGFVEDADFCLYTALKEKIIYG